MLGASCLVRNTSAHSAAGAGFRSAWLAAMSSGLMIAAGADERDAAGSEPETFPERLPRGPSRSRYHDVPIGAHEPGGRFRDQCAPAAGTARVALGVGQQTPNRIDVADVLALVAAQGTASGRVFAQDVWMHCVPRGLCRTSSAKRVNWQSVCQSKRG